MSKFPVPVSGEKIPHGWFANLVRFVNSLTLRGDGRYTMVSRNESGTTVTLTPAVKNAIERSGGTPPAAGGGASGIPNYAAGEQVTIGQTYTISAPGWLIGTVRTAFPAVSSDYFATWKIVLSSNGSQVEEIILSNPRFAKDSDVLEIDSFISMLIPAGFSFVVSVNSNLASGALTSTLKAYPLL